MSENAWQEGWWAHARRLDSPNFGPRPEGVPVSLVVIHSISLPPGVFGGGEVEALFTNQLDWEAHPYFQGIRGLEVSAHFFIRRDGECVQFVSTLERAWHAGRSSWAGRENCNDYSVGIELEGLEGGGFEAVQLQTLVKVLRAVAQIHTLEAVMGHEHVAPGRKADPGPGFDWTWLRHELAWSEVIIGVGKADER